MLKKYKFNTIPNGDGEAFAFVVNKETFEDIMQRKVKEKDKSKNIEGKYLLYPDDLFGLNLENKEFEVELTIKAIDCNPSNTKKVIINKCHGGYCFSSVFVLDYLNRKNNKEHFLYELEEVYNDEYDVEDEYYKKIYEVNNSDSNYSLYAFDKDYGDRIEHEDFEAIEDKIYILSMSMNIDREDPLAIAMIEEYERDNKIIGVSYSNPCIVEIPADIEYEIQDYDGAEWIAEIHKTWE